MTKQRIVTITAGIIGLIALSYYRLVVVPEAAREKQRQKEELLTQSHQGSPTNPHELVAEELAGSVMGTTFNIRYRRPIALQKEKLDLSLQSALDAVDQRMSTYKEDSELSRFNRQPAQDSFSLSPELFEVLKKSREISEQTQGAFEISVGPLINLWGFGPNSTKEKPSHDQIQKARAAVGPDKWSLSEAEKEGTRLHPHLYLDLSAIAKGYGADQAAETLQAAKVDNFMVEVGGEIRVQGQKTDQEGNLKPWTLGIEAPFKGERKLYGLLRMTGGALATSGDYRNYRESSDSLISHTFDPRSGQPTPSRTASVSVIRDTAMEADALATALSVLTPEEALSMANQYGWALLLLERTEMGLKDYKSTAFAKLDYRQIAAQPTK